MNEWAEYYDLEPWDSWRDNFHMSVLASTILRAAGVKDVDPSSFFYQSPTVRDERETDETLANLRALKRRGGRAGGR